MQSLPNRLPRVAAIHDMSGFGRCSLSVILPVLSVMGVQVCPVPTAVLSTHTGGLGEVEFRDVSFRYEANTDKVLDHVSLRVPAGSYVALAGSSGGGKTTLCSLIPRFYDVTSGSVCIDGKDVRDVTLKSLRGNIGIVQQDVYLFAGTVMDNILYGRPDASREEVIEAAKKANAHDFIMELPDGYDTDIGQRGVKLSGGQK